MNLKPGRSFEQNRVEMTKAISDSTVGGQNNFLSWFNQTASLEESMIRGAWDFAFYFASPEVCKHISKPEDKTCLEIGYGGGRLLNASRSFFKHTHGVDLHPFNKQVRDLLLKQKNEENFTLHRLDSNILPIADASVDYAYSFIVIQHFYSHEIFDRYLSELQRVIKSGGFINLFFANIKWYPNRLSWKWLKGVFNGVIEETMPPDSKTAYNTLWMSSRYVRSLMKTNCFEPIFECQSFKRIPDGCPNARGHQSGIFAVKG